MYSYANLPLATLWILLLIIEYFIIFMHSFIIIMMSIYCFSSWLLPWGNVAKVNLLFWRVLFILVLIYFLLIRLYWALLNMDSISISKCPLRNDAIKFHLRSVYVLLWNFVSILLLLVVVVCYRYYCCQFVIRRSEKWTRGKMAKFNKYLSSS